MTFKELLVESLAIGNIKKYAGEYSGDGIVYGRSNASRTAGDVLVLASVRKIDKSFKKDSMYVGPKGVGQITPRYDRFEALLVKALRENIVIGVPEVGVHNGRVYFDNGRHRFAVMRDWGFKTAPFAVKKEDVQEFKRRFA